MTNFMICLLFSNFNRRSLDRLIRKPILIRFTRGTISYHIYQSVQGSLCFWCSCWQLKSCNLVIIALINQKFNPSLYIICQWLLIDPWIGQCVGFSVSRQFWLFCRSNFSWFTHLRLDCLFFFFCFERISFFVTYKSSIYKKRM